jgi:hypothetical protein
MHSPLDHSINSTSSDCTAVVMALVKCHEENSKFRQIFTMACDDLDSKMRK